jgi:hypothetical protein
MSNIKVEFDTEKLIMKSAIVSGLSEHDSRPISCYAGKLNPDEIHSALYYANRTVIRLLVEEFNVPLDMVDDFLLSALSEALTREYNNRNKGVDDMDIRKSVKYRNQK